MEQIINFLEQYWGYTLVGGVSLGTVITFTITQIKTLIKDKTKNKNIDTMVSKADSLCEELNAREERREQELKQLTSKLEAQQDEVTKKQLEIAEKEAYFEKVQAATFQAISYLVVASKLPTEDKIALQEKFTTLLNSKAVEYKEVIKDEVIAVKDEVVAVKDEVIEKIIPDITTTIAATVEETKSLLDKYTKEG